MPRSGIDCQYNISSLPSWSCCSVSTHLSQDPPLAHYCATCHWVQVPTVLLQAPVWLCQYDVWKCNVQLHFMHYVSCARFTVLLHTNTARIQLVWGSLTQWKLNHSLVPRPLPHQIEAWYAMNNFLLTILQCSTVLMRLNISGTTSSTCIQLNYILSCLKVVQSF